jgi:hypothetical protein
MKKIRSLPLLPRAKGGKESTVMLFQRYPQKYRKTLIPQGKGAYFNLQPVSSHGTSISFAGIMIGSPT